jgi:Zn-dependent protease with chaperone function
VNSRLDSKLFSPKERPLFLLAVVFSTAVWLAAVIGTVGIGALVIGCLAFFVLAFHAVFLAHVRGNGVRVSRQQLPALYARCEEIAHKLGLERVPQVYLMQHGGILNAFATKLLSRRFVIVYSSLADACTDSRQLDFVIGHEIGHLAAGHLAWNAYLLPFHLLPWLGPAYSRAREYTCDRCGLAVVDSLEPALRGLTVLSAGGRLAQEVNLEAFANQRLETGSFWMATAELCMSHPYLCKRVAALQEVRQPGSIPVVRRNVLAYPLAPFLGFSVGGSSLIGIYIFILLLIGIPNFMAKTREFEQQAAQQGQHRTRVPPAQP